MNKTTRIAALLAALLLLTALLAGCAAKNTSVTPAAPEQPAAADTAAPAETPADDAAQDTADTPAADPAPADGAHITPIPSTFDPLALKDCVYPVSFTNDDIELNDEGTLILHLTVWDQELFDMVDISMLKPGDTITIRGEDIAVASVEQTDSLVHINGGLENGGVTLAASEFGGTFYESTAELTEYDAVYTAVAQLALPVDGDTFVYTDSSDPEAAEPETYLAGDLLIQQDTVDFSCTAMNGTAHIVNNQIAEITRIYTP